MPGPPDLRPLLRLQQALRTASPRLSPEPTPWRSVLIHGGVIVLWLALFARAFVLDGLFAWSTGLVYVGYDTALLLFVFVQTLPLLRPAPALPAPALPAATVAVIIAAHNEAAVLPQTLAALAAQTSPADEIVIADDGSADATAALLATRYGLALPPPGEWSNPSPTHPGLRWLRLVHGGKARALNAAITGTACEIVLTVDADTLLDPGAIAAMRHAFAGPALVAATGVLTPVCGPSVGGRLFELFQTYEYIRNFLSRYAWMRMDSLLLISGAFAGFRRDAVIAVGGFDTECLVEDYELIHRLRRHSTRHGLGWRTCVLGEARGRTEAPGSVSTFLRQRRRWFGGFLQTQLWYRAMVGDRRYGWLGVLMLPVKAVDTLQPVYGLTAIALLLVYVARGRFALVGPVAGVIGGKIVLDFAFHLWSVALYRRWVGGQTPARLWVALLASLVEPFTFQVLRHAGASWGWLVFLTGGRSWGVQRRVGLATPSGPAPP